MYIPYEVGFKEPKIGGNFFVLNRLMDVIFFLDMLIIFNTPYSRKESGVMVTSRRSIAASYIKSWFPLDVICLVPYDVIVAMAADAHTKVGVFRLIRFLRLFRILKVLRILKLNASAQKVQALLGLDYYTISLLKFAFFIFFAIHMMACGLHVVAMFEEADQNWVHDYFGEYSQAHSSLTLYITCMYWSAMTTSTIGYGDVAMITNAEKVYSIACMVIGATLYAFMTGNICGTVLRMNQFETDFGELTSELDSFLYDHDINSTLANSIRIFFKQQHALDQPYDQKKLLTKMSPVLRGWTAEMIHKPWMNNTFCLNEVTNKTFISHLSLIIETNMYAPHEHVVYHKSKADCMFIVWKGIAIVNSIDYKSKGDVIGEEMIRTPICKRNYRVHAGMRHVAMMEIKREPFLELVERFAAVKKQVKKAALKFAFREHIMEVLKKMKLQALQQMSDNKNAQVFLFLFSPFYLHGFFLFDYANEI